MGECKPNVLLRFLGVVLEVKMGFTENHQMNMSKWGVYNKTNSKYNKWVEKSGGHEHLVHLTRVRGWSALDPLLGLLVLLSV